MAKYTYIGDEPSVYIFATTFPKGTPVEVTDAHALKKLAAHPHFATVADSPASVKEPETFQLPAEAPEIGASLAPVNALMPAPIPPPRRGRPKKEKA